LWFSVIGAGVWGWTHVCSLPHEHELVGRQHLHHFTADTYATIVTIIVIRSSSIIDTSPSQLNNTHTCTHAPAANKQIERSRRLLCRR